MAKNIIIRPGDTVTVHSAANYGTDEKPAWYLEFTSDYWGYIYWKQGVDDGYLVSVTYWENGETVKFNN